MPTNSQKRDYIWNTVGVFLQNAISPLLLVLITRINGIYDSGLFSFAFAVSIVFWTFGMWGGRTYQVSDERGEFSHRSYITVRLLLAVAMFIGAFAFTWANQYDATKTGLVVALVLFKAVESIADSVHGVLQVHGRLYVAGRSLMYKALAGLMIFALIDLMTQDILLASIGVLAVNVLITWLYDLRAVRKVEDIRSHNLTKELRQASRIMKRCAAVFAVAFMAVFSLNIPRYFLDQYHPEEIGYFGIIAMPVTLIVLLMSFILQPNVVGLARLYRARDAVRFGAIIRRIITITSLIGVSILILFYLCGVPLLEFIFGIEFAHHKTPLLITIVGGMANALVAIYINVLTIMRRFKGQFYILLTTNILIAVLSAVLVQRTGLAGGVSLYAGIGILQTLLLAIVYGRTLLKMKDEKRD